MEISFEVVYNEYFTNLVRYFQFKTQSKSDAEELAQDVMLKVFKHLKEFDATKSALRTWIYNISKNTMIDYFRKDSTPKGNAMKYQVSTDSTVDEEFFQVFQVPDKGIKADSLHDSTMVADSIKTALNGLKSAQKELAEAFFIYEFTYNEMSEMFDLPLGTVKGNINRIREKLQSQLKNEYQLVCQ